MPHVLRPVACVQLSLLPTRPAAAASQRWMRRAGRRSRTWSGSSGAVATLTPCSGAPRQSESLLLRNYGWMDGLAPRTRPCGWACRRTRTPTTTVLPWAGSRSPSVLIATRRTRAAGVARARAAHSLALRSRARPRRARGRGCGDPGDPGRVGCPQWRRCSSPGSWWLCGGCRGHVSRQWWGHWQQGSARPKPGLSGPRPPWSGGRRRASGGRSTQFARTAGRRCQALEATPRRRRHATPRQRTSRLRPSC